MERALKRKSFQKPKDRDFFFAWLITRRISAPIAIFLTDKKIKPNQITLLSIVVGLISFAFFYKGDIRGDFIGAVLFQFSFLLDCVDGDLARIRNPNVKLDGIFIDYLRSSILEPLFPLFLSLGLYNQGYPLIFVIFIASVSFWKLIPQFSREHVTVRVLDRNPDLITIFSNSNILKDSPKKFGNSRLPGRLVRIILSIWGLPIGLMNSITVLAILGLIFLPLDYYLDIKFIYLAILGALYSIFFIKSCIYEFRQLKIVEDKRKNL